MARRKPRKTFYLEQPDPLWIFRVNTKRQLQVFLDQGCHQITREEYDSYPVKGCQDV